MKKRKGRSSVKPKRRNLFGKLVLFALFLVVGGVVAYNILPEEGKQGAQEAAIKGLSWLRDREETSRQADEAITWFIRRIPAYGGVQIADAGVFGENPLLLAGLPVGSGRVRILENEGYLVGYDEELKIPRWVAYKIFVLPGSKAPDRPEGFDIDPRTVSRVSQSDYTGSGYDRGHMAPNYGIALSWGAQAQQETFLMSNIVPQHPDLNRGPWRDLEAKVVGYSRRYGEIWVITGPIFEGSSRKIIDEDIAVPDGFFKILADVDEGSGALRVIAYVFPQEDFGRSRPYSLVTADAIEEATGLDFFGSLPDEVEERLESRVPIAEW